MDENTIKRYEHEEVLDLEEVLELEEVSSSAVSILHVVSNRKR